MLRTRFLLFLSPIGLYLLWIVIRRIRGQRNSRFVVTTSLSLVLLLYFLTVTGTGIYWVAAQELPVFDWHYLPGYILLALGLLHVVLHWRTIMVFLRQQAPKAAVAAGGTRFRWWVRVLGTGLLLAIFGLCAFFMGMRQGSQRMTIVTRQPSAAALPKIRQAGLEPLIAPEIVDIGGVSMTLSQMYHEATSYPARVPVAGLTLSSKPDLYKDYPGANEISLPVPASQGGGQVQDAYQSWITGKALPSSGELTTERLSSLLFHAQGVTTSVQRHSMTLDLRTAPSAGALYPVNLYVLVSTVRGVAPGLYYYHPKKSSLVLVKADPSLTLQLKLLSGSPELYEGAPAVVIFSTTFGRTAFKYKDRSYRYVAMDTGHAAYNLGLVAASFGLRAPMIARFDDRALDTMLGLDSAAEAGILIMPIGGTATTSAEPLFLREQATSAAGTQPSALELIHRGTSLRLGGGHGQLVRHPIRERDSGRLVHLPAPAQGNGLLEAIHARRSVREFSGASMSLEELSALCGASNGPGEASAMTDPLLSTSSPLALYVVVRDVATVAAGVYRYVPERHALALIKEGDFSKSLLSACMHQEFCGTANVVFVKTAKWADMLYPDGDRGYRYANLRAGAMSEGVYVQGTALGIGACGVGAFQDPEVAALVGIDLNEEVPLYLTAAGKAKNAR